MKKLRFRVHPAGMIVFAASLLLLDSRLVLSSVMALFLHEGAHLMTMLLCGMKECTIELTPFGGMADARYFEEYSPWKRILVAASGVLASALSAAVCLKMGKTDGFLLCFRDANASLAFMNMLPAWPLDGARVLAALGGCLGCEKFIRKLLSYLSTTLGFSAVLLGLYGVWKGIVNPSLLVIGPYLCYAARAGNVADQIRKVTEADQKLSRQAFLPVELWATSDGSNLNIRRFFNDYAKPNRYPLLLKIDSQSGNILECMTEKKILNSLFANDGKN